MRRRAGQLAAATLVGALAGACLAGPGAGIGTTPGERVVGTASGERVVAAGRVPDDATRQRVLERLHAVFGADAVDDRIAVGDASAPAGWSESLAPLLGPALRRVRGGQLRIVPGEAAVSGEVPAAADRDAVRAALRRDGYRLRDALRLGRGSSPIDAAMAGRSVGFDPGAATLTPDGERLLADLLPRLQALPGRRFEIVGHTDAVGSREANLALSRARAEAVRRWFATRGIAPERLGARGVGPDEPVVDNASAAGRARNRRIAFRIVEPAEETAWTPPR